MLVPFLPSPLVSVDPRQVSFQINRIQNDLKASIDSLLAEVNRLSTAPAAVPVVSGERSIDSVSVSGVTTWTSSDLTPYSHIRFRIRRTGGDASYSKISLAGLTGAQGYSLIFDDGVAASTLSSSSYLFLDFDPGTSIEGVFYLDTGGPRHGRWSVVTTDQSIMGQATAVYEDDASTATALEITTVGGTWTGTIDIWGTP